MFTGRGREEIAIEAFENGADFYLQKGGEPRNRSLPSSGTRYKTAVDHRRADLQVIYTQPALYRAFRDQQGNRADP